MQKHVNLVDLVKSFPTNIYLQKLASIQKRTSPVKFAHLAEKSGKGSISNLSTKARARAAGARRARFLGGSRISSREARLERGRKFCTNFLKRFMQELILRIFESSEIICETPKNNSRKLLREMTT